MIGFLRYLGLLNAAVWLGAAVSFTLAIGPAFFSPQMKAVLPPPYNGAAAQIVIRHYFVLLHFCGAIAVLHLLLEKLYLGKAADRLTLLVLSVTIGLGLIGGFWVQPKLKELHLRWYDMQSLEVLRAQAQHSFGVWHGVSQTMNLIVIIGLSIYLWRVSNPPGASRFLSSNKFRS